MAGGRGMDTVTGLQRRLRASLASLAPPHSPEAPLVVQPGLFTFGSMEPTVPQLAQDARPLQ